MYLACWLFVYICLLTYSLYQNKTDIDNRVYIFGINVLCGLNANALMFLIFIIINWHHTANNIRQNHTVWNINLAKNTTIFKSKLIYTSKRIKKLTLRNSPGVLKSNSSQVVSPHIGITMLTRENTVYFRKKVVKPTVA